MMVKDRTKNTFADLNHKNTEVILEKFGRSDVIIARDETETDSFGKVTDVTRKSFNLEKADLQFVNSYQDRQIIEQGLAKVGDGVLYTVFSEDLQTDDLAFVDAVTWRLKEQIEAETLGPDKIYQAWVVIRTDQ